MKAEDEKFEAEIRKLETAVDSHTKDNGYASTDPAKIKSAADRRKAVKLARCQLAAGAGQRGLPDRVAGAWRR